MNDTSINPGVPWPAIDALGRELPLPEEVGPPRPDRFVGIFYFLWMDAFDQGPYDVSKIMAEHPDGVQNPEGVPWGPHGYFHFWGESIWGYYRSEDPWVLRRHAHLLADAGIDTLIFDTTNRVTYKNTYMKLCEVFAQVRAEGGRTPQIAFMTNTKAGETAREIYEDLYKPGLYSDLWFRWGGKPLMICDPDDVGEEVREFFTLRKAHWPFTMVDTPYAWHWEAAYPQPYGFTDDPDTPEQVNVSVAQNLRIEDGKVTNMSDGNARGRSFHGGARDTAPDAVLRGHNFAEQWKRAYELDPPFVMVTGWNEWVAGKWSRPGQPVVFVDQFDQEHSRDIEPMKGGHGDNYYYQLVAGVRRYKGAPPLPEPSDPVTIDITGPSTQWDTVAPAFTDHAGETLPRDFGGAGKDLHYTNDTGRNEVRLAKVARDAGHVYFLVRTEDDLTPPEGDNWMTLFIGVGDDLTSGWEGFDFVVNRVAPEDGAAVVERNTGGWNWDRVGEAPSHIEGNELRIAVPRALLGLTEGAGPLTLDFKWADNLQRPGDPMDFYLSGDCAPNGRFRYRYQVR